MKAPLEAKRELRNQLHGLLFKPTLQVLQPNAGSRRPHMTCTKAFFSQVQKLPAHTHSRGPKHSQRESKTKEFIFSCKSSLSRAVFMELQEERSAEEGNSKNNF